jgi:hypothetical protein
MHKTIARKGSLIAAALLLATCFAVPASATDSMTWNPLTPAGGLVSNNPSYWDNRALVPFDGAGLISQSVVLAPSNQFITSTTNDYSTPVTNVSGNQITTNTSTNDGAGSTVSITTNTGAPSGP